MMNVRIVSPAGSIQPEVVEKGLSTIQSWGWSASVAPHALSQFGRYAGTPTERAADLVDALLDPSVDIIWCARGGYGCMQILDSIDEQMIRQTPKWLIGYSDITALHALWQKAGVPSLHAPMMKHLGENPEHATTLKLKALLDAIPSPAQLDSESKTAQWKLSIDSHPLNRAGEVCGTLIGGNLAVLSGLHSTPYDWNYQDAILFIEDIAESPYKLDRMLQTLRLSGALQQIGGLIVGQFADCHEDPMMGCSIVENIAHIMEPYDIPILFDMPVGHVTNNHGLIEGGRYRICVNHEGLSSIELL